jgi:hypothetical protein
VVYEERDLDKRWEGDSGAIMADITTLYDQIESKGFSEQLRNADSLRMFLIEAWKLQPVDQLFEETRSPEGQEKLVSRIEHLLSIEPCNKVALVIYLYILELRNAQRGKALTVKAQRSLNTVPTDLVDAFYQRVFHIEYSVK